jgi:hypothetical protein
VPLHLRQCVGQCVCTFRIFKKQVRCGRSWDRPGTGWLEQVSYSSWCRLVFNLISYRIKDNTAAEATNTAIKLALIPAELDVPSMHL